MKYQYGDLVYIKTQNDGINIMQGKPFIDVLQIIEYVDKLDKYLCVCAPYSLLPSFCFILVEEKDLIPYDDSVETCDGFYYISENGKPIYPKNIDTNFFKIYTYKEGKLELFRKAFRRLKHDYDIPLKEPDVPWK